MKTKEKIIVIDDEEINITILNELLKDKYEIISFTKPKYVIKEIQNIKPNLILLDIMMPDINGFEICQKLKKNYDTQNIPIIFITSLNDGEHIKKAFSYGSVDYVVKPFMPVELKVRIKTQLKVSRIQNELKELASTDYMTKLYNRRYFNRISSHLIDLARRENNEISIIMLDIDKFKIVNDTYGHYVGDKVIIAIANKLIKSQRKSDIACRFGGEEFVILLANTSLEGGKIFANKIREEIENMRLLINNHKIKSTISLGVSSVNIHNEQNIEEAIKRADIALYEAKQTGRNKVCIN